MIIVHNRFVCKPGNAGKLAKMFKELLSIDKSILYIMTDMTGPWHQVISVSQYKSLADYEKSLKKWSKPDPKMQKMNEKFANMNEMYVSGSREIYKVW